MNEFDEYKVFRGMDIPINNTITVTIPTVDQIAEFGEREYFNAVYSLTSVGADLKWQLWDSGIDYTKIEDYELFIKMISQIVGSKKHVRQLYIEHPEVFEELHKKNPDGFKLSYSEEELDDMLINPLQLVLKDIDLADYEPYVQTTNGQVILYNKDTESTIDKLAYLKIVDIIRRIHGFKRNNQIPANERTKMDLIEDARDEYMMSKTKPFKSILLPLHSSLEVYCGQCGTGDIGKMPISAFFYDIKRVARIEEANHLLQGAYSGFAKMDGVDKTRFDMFGDV